MLLSAALIVRDEADHLERCLGSLRGLVDEILVVDTGSTDTSVAVAERHGAVVAHEPWVGDFSIPRNRSLDLASGEWILYIDADEHVRDGNRALARAAIAATRDCVALLPRFVPIVGHTPYYEYRLWRNLSEIRFRGGIHETPVPDIERVADRDGLRVEPFDLLTIDHFGYEGDQSAKRARDEPMLLAEIERLPERTYLYDHLARVYAAAGDSARAIATWRRGMEVARARGGTDPSDRLLFGNLMSHLIATGSFDELEPLIREVLDRFPGIPVFELAAASHELANGLPAQAITRLDWLLSLDEDALLATGLSYDQRVLGEWAWHLLGRCRLVLGDAAGAADAFREAESLAPANLEYRVERQLAEARVAAARTERSGA
jgi:tetratricopeptide (TPR) repeat protein